MVEWQKKECYDLTSMVEKEYLVPGDDINALGFASSDVKNTLKSLGVSPSVIKRTAVSMYEAEINTAIHGGGGKGFVKIAPPTITIIFEDSGPGIPDIPKAMTEGFSTAPDHIREMGFGAGMGLPNIKRNCDDLQIFSEVGKGTKIVITINLEG